MMRSRLLHLGLALQLQQGCILLCSGTCGSCSRHFSLAIMVLGEAHLHQLRGRALPGPVTLAFLAMEAETRLMLT